MTTFSPLRETLLKALLKAALAGYHHLSAHFQKVKAEMTELSDYDLFEETKRHPHYIYAASWRALSSCSVATISVIFEM